MATTRVNKHVQLVRQLHTTFKAIDKSLDNLKSIQEFRLFRNTIANEGLNRGMLMLANPSGVLNTKMPRLAANEKYDRVSLPTTDRRNVAALEDADAVIEVAQADKTECSKDVVSNLVASFDRFHEAIETVENTLKEVAIKISSLPGGSGDGLVTAVDSTAVHEMINACLGAVTRIESLDFSSAQNISEAQTVISQIVEDIAPFTGVCSDGSNGAEIDAKYAASEGTLSDKGYTPSTTGMLATSLHSLIDSLEQFSIDKDKFAEKLKLLLGQEATSTEPPAEVTNTDDTDALSGIQPGGVVNPDEIGAPPTEVYLPANEDVAGKDGNYSLACVIACVLTHVMDVCSKQAAELVEVGTILLDDSKVAPTEGDVVMTRKYALEMLMVEAGEDPSIIGEDTLTNPEAPAEPSAEVPAAPAPEAPVEPAPVVDPVVTPEATAPEGQPADVATITAEPAVPPMDGAPSTDTPEDLTPSITEEEVDPLAALEALGFTFENGDVVEKKEKEAA